MWGGTGSLVAIRAQLGRDRWDCPVVKLDAPTGESVLVADHICSLVPALVLEHLRWVPEVQWDVVRDADEIEWLRIRDVHQALGGSTAEIDSLREVLADDELRRFHVRESYLPPSARPEGYSAALERVLGERPLLDYFLHDQRIDSFVPRPAPDAGRLKSWALLGWTVHTYTVSYGAERFISEEEERFAVTEAVRRPVGHEGPYQGPTVLRSFTGLEASGKGPSWHIARRVVELGLEDAHLLTGALAAMHAAGPGNYDGMAHAAAAEAAHEAGDVATAVSAMLSFLFFQSRRPGGATPEIVHAYRTLCRELDASPHHEMVLELLERAGRSASSTA